MPNSIFENVEKRRKKEGGWKLKLATGLAGNVINNITLHDVFTLLLVIITIIIVLIL
jgi:hypothetical protein